MEGKELEAYIDDLVDIYDSFDPMKDDAPMGDQDALDDDSDMKAQDLSGNQGIENVV